LKKLAAAYPLFFTNLAFIDYSPAGIKSYAVFGFGFRFSVEKEVNKLFLPLKSKGNLWKCDQPSPGVQTAAKERRF